jgi:hypothetical protein
MLRTSIGQPPVSKCATRLEFASASRIMAASGAGELQSDASCRVTTT